MTVVADTSPINYLVLIGAIDLLRELFRGIQIPSAVLLELREEDSPPTVRQWAIDPPNWVALGEPPDMRALDGFDLHEGELAALHLAKSVNADLGVIDEMEGRSAARSLGLSVIGTLGVLELADVRGLVDFQAAVDRLHSTSFRVSPRLVSEFLNRHRARRLGR